MALVCARQAHARHALAHVVTERIDRSPIGSYADVGLAFRNIWSTRPNDAFGMAVAYCGPSDC